MNLLYARDVLEIGTVWKERMKKIKYKDVYQDTIVYVGGWRDGEGNGWGLETRTRDNYSFPLSYYQKPFLYLV